MKTYMNLNIHNITFFDFREKNKTKKKNIINKKKKLIKQLQIQFP